MQQTPDTLKTLVTDTLNREVPAEISAMAEHLRGRHGTGVAAIVAYGSCLRGVPAADSLIDLYVLTSAGDDDRIGLIARIACRLVPPNVYYVETTHQTILLRCKYAMLPLDQFQRWMTRATSNPYFWARFAQPTALVYHAGEAERQLVTQAISSALQTAFANAKGLSGSALGAPQTWQKLFENTYATELRAEGPGRARDLVLANQRYFEDAAILLADEPAIAANWAWRRFAGRSWSVARLVKAAFTFTGGADYLAWKIERHSGHKVVLSDWHRRHPLLASLVLLPRLLSKGAVR